MITAQELMDGPFTHILNRMEIDKKHLVEYFVSVAVPARYYLIIDDGKTPISMIVVDMRTEDQLGL